MTSWPSNYLSLDNWSTITYHLIEGPKAYRRAVKVYILLVYRTLSYGILTMTTQPYRK